MKTHLDDILINFSMFGQYYVKFMVLVFFAYLSSNMYSSNFVFVTEEVGYRCKDERFNNTCTQLINSTEVCTEWTYDDPNSFVAEFQLACQDWKRTLVGTVHSIGYMVGLLIIGPLSDRLGRKKIIVTTGLLSAVVGVARSYTNWYWLFVALEFIEGAIADNSSPVFMISIEMVAHEKRLVYQMLCGVGFSFGYLSLAIVAWLFPYWRQMLRVIYGSAVLFFLYYYLLDESPRWLLSRGKKEKAVAILKKIAKQNKSKLNKDMLDNIHYEESKEITFCNSIKKTFKSKVLVKRFFICLSWWATSTFVNYGMQITSVSLAGNKYINYGLIMIVDLIGNVMIIYVMLRFRRKIPLIGSFLFTAIFCFSLPFVPTSLPWLSVLLFMVGKLMSSAYFIITYIFTSELFPTYTRNSMHALCSSIGRVGSIIAPQTPLLAVYWEGLPSLVFGGASLVAGLATMFAPDTANEALPDSVTQAEKLGIENYDEINDSTLVPLPLKYNTQL